MRHQTTGLALICSETSPRLQIERARAGSRDDASDVSNISNDRYADAIFGPAWITLSTAQCRNRLKLRSQSLPQRTVNKTIDRRYFNRSSSHQCPSLKQAHLRFTGKHISTCILKIASRSPTTIRPPQREHDVVRIHVQLCFLFFTATELAPRLTS